MGTSSRSGSGGPRGRRRTHLRTHLMGERFFRQSERDLEIAHSVVAPRSAYLAANLAHQAAEKALKAAVWSLQGREPPWKHPLRQLAESAVDDPSQIPASVGAAIAFPNPL